MSMFQNATLTSGSGSVTDASSSAALLAAPGAGKLTRLMGGVICVTTAAVGGGGLVSIKNGTTVIFSAEGDAVGAIPFSFGEQGFPLTANAALNLVTESAVTTQATANAAVVAKVVG